MRIPHQWKAVTTVVIASATLLAIRSIPEREDRSIELPQTEIVIHRPSGVSYGFAQSVVRTLGQRGMVAVKIAVLLYGGDPTRVLDQVNHELAHPPGVSYGGG